MESSPYSKTFGDSEGVDTGQSLEIENPPNFKNPQSRESLNLGLKSRQELLSLAAECKERICPARENSREKSSRL